MFLWENGTWRTTESKGAESLPLQTWNEYVIRGGLALGAVCIANEARKRQSWERANLVGCVIIDLRSSSPYVGCSGFFYTFFLSDIDSRKDSSKT